ncbi:MAG TPA: hypothetical protein VLX61_01255 [Anaerolineales bacterium]|nr:hypothetical protein [Anaerolineales bacterium]
MMDRTQKRILWLLVALGAIYFIAFIFPNSTGAKTYSMISLFSPDEHIQYPTPLFMLSGDSFKEILHHFVLYRDYSYGFPFYGGSALVLLPLKLTHALNSQNVQLALLLLRQFISVLPMLLAILLMVYTQTKFRSYLTSIITFIFLLLVTAVVENDLWWHADSLAVLFVVLVFFFLDRDELKLGINFRLAAVACGLATATKVLGLFFFLTIPVYILIGIQQKRMAWKQALPAAAVFVVLLALVIVAADPFLLIQSERQQMLRLIGHISSTMTNGYALYYVKDAFTWLSVLAGLAWPPFLILMALTLLLGIWKSPRPVLHALILCWMIPFFFYIFYVLSAELTHYFLPILIPWFSCVATALELKPASWLSERSGHGSFLRRWGNGIWLAMAVLIVGYQALNYLSSDFRLYQNHLTREQTSPAIQFYDDLNQKYLSVLPSNQTYVIFRDVRIYFPDSASNHVISFYVTTNYATVQRDKPDIIVLWQQRVSDYTQPGALAAAINKNAFQAVYQFFSDASKGQLAGFHLIYRNDTGLAFVSDTLYQKYFRSP